MNTVTKAFNALLAPGRASAMQAVGIKMVRDSALSLTEGARSFLENIYGDLFSPTMREDSIVQWEKQFNLTPGKGSTLQQRRAAIEEAWRLTGAQGRGYIENQLNRAGFDVVVTNNIPYADLTLGEQETMSDIETGVQATNPFSMTDDPDGLGMWEGFQGYLFGNGRIVINDGGTVDPIEAPVAVGAGVTTQMSVLARSMTDKPASWTTGRGYNGWAYVFLIEGENGSFANVPSSRREEFERLVLKLKPSHLGIIMRVHYI